MRLSEGQKFLVFLTEGDERQASSLHRVYLIAPELRAQGWNVEIVTGQERKIGRSVIWWVGLRSLWRALRTTRRNGFLVVHKTAHVGVAALCVLARMKGVRVIVDFDDAIQLPWRLGLPHPLYCALPVILMNSTAAWCGSHYLVDYAGKFTNAAFIPTPVAPEFETAKVSQDDPPTIVWVGNAPANLASLRLLASPLSRLSRVCNFKLRILSAFDSEAVRDVFSGLEGRIEVDYGWSSWQPIGRIADAVGHCDIGVMPLEDTPWNRGKCSMKALESMASGLAVVVSGVGENTVVAGDQEYALVARSSDEWYRALRTLLCVPQLRKYYGQRGQARVAESYSLLSVMTSIEQMLHSST